MTKSQSDILKASPGKIAGLMDLGSHPARVWHPEELGAVYRHQMAAPISVDLEGLPRPISGQLRNLTDANGLLLKSFQELFDHARPPLELLSIVKEFAKRNRGRPESLLPDEVATVLYFLSIATALLRWQERISRLSDDELQAGFKWSLAQPWIDDSGRNILTAARNCLPPSAQLG
jgi:hypothetical protein